MAQAKSNLSLIWKKTLVIYQFSNYLWFLNSHISLYIQNIYVLIFNVTRGTVIFDLFLAFIWLYLAIARTASEMTGNRMGG